MHLAFVTFFLFPTLQNIAVWNLRCQALKIGAIFDEANSYQQRTLNLAISTINRQRFQQSETPLEVLTESIPKDNPFEALHTTCELIERGVVAILGPSSEDNSNTVQAVCDEKEIPMLDVRWDDEPTFNGVTVNVYPYQKVLTQAYVDILKAWNYHDFIILYENNDSLKRVGQLLNKHNNLANMIMLRQLDEERIGTYRKTLKDVWRSGATHFVLDCSIDILEEVLRQAQQVGLMTNRHNYFITNLDLHTIDLTPYQYSETNITGMRLINPESDAVRMAAFEIYKSDYQQSADVNFGFVAAWKLQLQFALIHDAILMLGEAFDELPSAYNVPMPINCSTPGSWTYGTTLMNFMRGLSYSGLSGPIRFDRFGYRSQFSLELFELKEGGITKVANWTNGNGLNVSRPMPHSDSVNDNTLANKTFIVIICETPPYSMLKETSSQLYGNDRFEGFGIDLIHELSLMAGFNYTYILREDKANGQYNEKTKKWSGMIGDVIDGVADLAIADLTITAERATAVDFTTPFMDLGISILYQKAKKAPPSFFSFADPFALDVWKLLIVALFAISIAMFVLGRMAPAEWTNPYPCIQEPDHLVNQMSLRNCFWFTTGSMMQQGSEIAPIAMSTRMLAGMWWFFTLIMVSSYTANLAAFLTTENPDPHFTNVFELVEVAEKKGIKYGAKAKGATETFFREKRNQIKEYGKIYEYMQQNNDEVMVQDNILGVLKAEKENYAFFMESTSIEYEIQRRCGLTRIGNMLDEKGYGIAMRKNSTLLRNKLTTAILKLKESGKMAAIKRKWWEERRGGGQCQGDEEKNTAAKALNLKNVGGVFWVTMGGTFLALVLAMIEMLLHTVKKALRSKMPFAQAVKQELSFVCAFSSTVKPAAYSLDDVSTQRKDDDDSSAQPSNNSNGTHM